MLIILFETSFLEQAFKVGVYLILLIPVPLIALLGMFYWLFSSLKQIKINRKAREEVEARYAAKNAELLSEFNEHHG